MSTSRAVARGTARLVAGLLAAKAMDFALYLFLARTLGVELFGRYTFALSFTLLFNIVADLGLTTVFTREAARSPERVRSLLSNTLTLKALLGAVTVAATTAISVATGAPWGTTLLVATFTLAMLVNSGALLFEGLLKAGGRAGVAGLAVLAQSATALATGLVLVLSGLGPLGGACAYLVGATAHLGAAVWASRASWRARSPALAAATAVEARTTAALRAQTLRALLRESLPLAISGVFIALYFRVDSVMLHAMKGERAVGLYGGIYRFFEGFVLLSAAYRSVLFPVMARTADGPRESLGVLCRKSIRLHLLFTVGVATFFSFEARPIVTLVLGRAYEAAAPGLAVLVWALPGAYMADMLLHLLTAQRRQAEGARVAVAVALFNVALNAVLIPRLSLVGASAATVASEALCFALLFAAFRRGSPAVGLARLAWRPLAAGLALAGALALARPLVPAGATGLVAAAGVALVAYAGTLVVLRGLGREDLELALSLVPGRRGGRGARGARGAAQPGTPTANR